MVCYNKWKICWLIFERKRWYKILRVKCMCFRHIFAVLTLKFPIVVNKWRIYLLLFCNEGGDISPYYYVWIKIKIWPALFFYSNRTEIAVRNRVDFVRNWVVATRLLTLKFALDFKFDFIIKSYYLLLRFKFP